MSVCVVAWHMVLFGTSSIWDKEHYSTHFFTISDLINFHILVLAVPSFILISCYLRAIKNFGLWDLKKQIYRLVLLSVFWTAVSAFWANGARGLLTLVPRSPWDCLVLILTSGHTEYYFFVSLSIALTMTYLASKMPTALNAIFLFISGTILFFLPMLAIELRFDQLVAWWNPLNFIPYSFAGVLIARTHSRLLKTPRRLIVCVTLVILGVLFSLYEWRFDINEIFLSYGYAIPSYTRVSLLCFCTAALIAFLSPTIPTNGIVRFMSRHSLALYCLHPFFIGGAGDAIGRMHLPTGFARPLQFITVISACYVVSLLLPMFLKEKLIR